MQPVFEHRQRLRPVIDQHALADQLVPGEARIRVIASDEEAVHQIDLGEMRNRRSASRLHRRPTRGDRILRYVMGAVLDRIPGGTAGRRHSIFGL